MAPAIRQIYPSDPEFPPLLREIPHPPASLYMRGRLPRTDSVAIVGTRKATDKGLELARACGAALARAGVAVVSGLALGIDAAAHEGALAAAGRTVAVLPCGPDKIYPSTNARLGEKVLQSGALLSEYPPGTPPEPFRFLERNRLISGLCRAVLIIEAPERSGALATARFALEQNRDVYAAPGPAGHPNYAGAHRLIREGAMLVDGPADLLADLGFPAAPPPDQTGPVTVEEAAVLNVLRFAARALAIDELAAAVKLSPPEVHRNLASLILKGVVREESGGYAV